MIIVIGSKPWDEPKSTSWKLYIGLEVTCSSTLNQMLMSIMNWAGLGYSRRKKLL